jgi:hypothetical protein
MQKPDFPSLVLDVSITALHCTRIIVAKSKELKTG